MFERLGQVGEFCRTNGALLLKVKLSQLLVGYRDRVVDPQLRVEIRHVLFERT